MPPTVLPFIFSVVIVVAPPRIPIVWPPTPVELNPEMVLFAALWVAPPLLDPIEIAVSVVPVTVGAYEIFEIMLLETVVLLLPKFDEIMVIPVDVVERAAPDILLKVLFVMVLVGPLDVEAPSVLLQPAIGVLPVTVTLEKLLRLFVIAEPLTDEANAK
jgi:hypothetical protein